MSVVGHPDAARAPGLQARGVVGEHSSAGNVSYPRSVRSIRPHATLPRASLRWRIPRAASRSSKMISLSNALSFEDGIDAPSNFCSLEFTPLVLALPTQSKVFRLLLVYPSSIRLVEPPAASSVLSVRLRARHLLSSSKQPAAHDQLRNALRGATPGRKPCEDTLAILFTRRSVLSLGTTFRERPRAFSLAIFGSLRHRISLCHPVRRADRGDVAHCLRSRPCAYSDRTIS